MGYNLVYHHTINGVGEALRLARGAYLFTVIRYYCYYNQDTVLGVRTTLDEVGQACTRRVFHTCSQSSEASPTGAHKETLVWFIGGSHPLHTEVKKIKALMSNTGEGL